MSTPASETARAAASSDTESRKDVLDFPVTEEALGAASS